LIEVIAGLSVSVAQDGFGSVGVNENEFKVSDKSVRNKRGDGESVDESVLCGNFDDADDAVGVVIGNDGFFVVIIGFGVSGRLANGNVETCLFFAAQVFAADLGCGRCNNGEIATVCGFVLFDVFHRDVSV